MNEHYFIHGEGHCVGENVQFTDGVVLIVVGRLPSVRNSRCDATFHVC